MLSFSDAGYQLSEVFLKFFVFRSGSYNPNKIVYYWILHTLYPYRIVSWKYVSYFIEWRVEDQATRGIVIWEKRWSWQSEETVSRRETEKLGHRKTMAFTVRKRTTRRWHQIRCTGLYAISYHLFLTFYYTFQNFSKKHVSI
jgi:hypothetical protein